jgi:hypothetical protein
MKKVLDANTALSGVVKKKLHGERPRKRRCGHISKLALASVRAIRAMSNEEFYHGDARSHGKE